MSGQSHSKNRKENQTGSPQSGEPLYLAVGKLRRTHGLQGEILMDILTEFAERFKVGSTVYVGARHVPFVIRSFRMGANTGLIAFEGLDDCDQAAVLRNQIVYGAVKDSPVLAEGEYYQHQIIGLQVVDEAGHPLGTVKEILETGANDVYVVSGEGTAELLLPAIKSVILNINIGEKRIVVRLPEWD